MKDDDRPFHPCDRRRTDEERRTAALSVFPSVLLKRVLAGELNMAAQAIARIAAWTAERKGGIAVLAGVTGAGKTTAAIWLAVQRTDVKPVFLRAVELSTASRLSRLRKLNILSRCHIHAQ